MRLVALIAAALLVLPGCATTRQNEMLWHGLNVVDGMQSASFCDNLQEGNPFIGPDPSDAELAAWIVGFSLVYHALNRWFENNEPGSLEAFQKVTIGGKVAVILWNGYMIDKEC